MGLMNLLGFVRIIDAIKFVQSSGSMAKSDLKIFTNQLPGSSFMHFIN